MITIINTEVCGFGPAIRGMRNPKNSWDKSDSFSCMECVPAFFECETCPHRVADSIYGEYCSRNGVDYVIGDNDKDLMQRLNRGGPVHAKYRRMIAVYVDINAPFYWWKEFDTYKVGTTANSCSTMHKIHEKEFTLDDFSHEHLTMQNRMILKDIITILNHCRENFNSTKDKLWWQQMIQLLPTSYNQKRTIMLNYEVLAGMYRDRRHHKLIEWHEFCKWVESLPYSWIITGKENEDGET